MLEAGRRILEQCDVLAAFSETPERLTRTFLSAPMRDVHAALSDWMRQAGMIVRLDAVGNLIGRYPAAREPARTLLIGSHLDTVPNAGKYDGILGVLLGLALVEQLQGRRLPFALEVIGFSEEEGVRFHKPYLGSLAAAGKFDPLLLELQDKAGATVAEVLHAYGLDPNALPQAAYDPDNLIGYLEVHIEQGPVLERLDAAVGVVEAIAGQSRLRLRFEGRAGHAGTVPMALRQDALAGAAEFVSAVEACGRKTDGLVATVGSLRVSPDAPNVIAGATDLTLDVRHADDLIRERAVDELRERARTLAEQRGLTVEFRNETRQPAVRMDPALTEYLSSAVEAYGHSVHRLVSGPGHDAAILAGVTPAAMLFVRSPGGVSHCPEEAVRPEDVAAALEVLLRLLDIVERNRT